MVFGDDECTHLISSGISSGEARSKHCLPLPLQAAEEEQYTDHMTVMVAVFLLSEIWCLTLAILVY